MQTVAFVILGTPVTWLEFVAFLLAIGCVAMNIREIHWGWPLAIVSSLMYGWLFAESRLYGQAALQLFFAVVAVWGWRQWLRVSTKPTSSSGRAQRAVRIARLGRRGVVLSVVAWGVGAMALGFVLDRLTDSDAPWLDAIPTVGSLIGQWMLGRKHLENWWVWIVVNLFSIGLFASKGLWLTVSLYAILCAMAFAGLAGWRARLAARGGLADGPERA